MREITIRRLKLKDTKALIQFFESLSERTKRLFHPHKFDKKTAEKVCNEKKDFYYGLFYGNEIVGYSMLRGFGEGYKIPSYGGCIADKRQGLGMGQLLMEWTIKQAKEMGCKKIILKVYKTNTTALHIYRKFGFKTFETTYRMEKRL